MPKIHTLLAALACTLLLVTGAAGDTELDSLVRRLESGGDFRVRVQAALQLGKTHDPAYTSALGRALDDKNDSVRAAAAAALKTLGDPDAIDHLRESRLDRSPAVRRQVLDALAFLETRLREMKVVVKIGRIRNSTNVNSPAAVSTLAVASRRTLGSLEAVGVVGESQDVNEVAKRRKLPALLLTGSIRKMGVEKSAGALIYSAQVEYVLHRMPEQAIAGKMTGSASTRASAEEASDSHRRAELRDAVLEAAAQSALKRARSALIAAASM
jgi:HEAT repeat protein